MIKLSLKFIKIINYKLKNWIYKYLINQFIFDNNK